MSNENVVELWKQYSRPSKSSMANLPFGPNAKPKPNGKPKPKGKPRHKPKEKASIDTKAGKLDIQQHRIQASKQKQKPLNVQSASGLLNLVVN